MTEFRFRAGFRVNEAGLARQVQPILRRTHSSLTRRIHAQAVADVPVRTGHLGRSHRELPQVFRSPFHVSGGVGAFATYAAPVHEGSRAHRITAKNGKALRFIGSSGDAVFRRSVWHPATRARPWLLNAARRVVATDPRVH